MTKSTFPYEASERPNEPVMPGATGSILGPISFIKGHGTRRGAEAGRLLSTLPSVHVSGQRVIKEIAGLRPYRPMGFSIRTEKLGEKLIIHNYGHGGAGITLSWGTAEIALERVNTPPGSSIAVLGCGVIGLSTAVLLQRTGYRVTIYCKKPALETISNVAAALWAPVSIFDDSCVDDTFRKQFRKATQISQQTFEKLIGSEYGISWIKSYLLDGEFNSPASRHVSSSGMENDRFECQGLEEFSTLLIEPPIYLRALTNDFLRAGGIIEIAEFIKPGDFARLNEPILMNCTGLGSYHLFDDHDLIPVKGQLTILQPQPEIQYSYILDSKQDLFYMFPRKDGIILGGTMERGNWSGDPDPNVSAHILDGHKAIALRMK